jgi:hypothetical protein
MNNRVYNLRSPELTGNLLKVERVGTEYLCTVKLDDGKTLSTETGGEGSQVWCPVTGGLDYREWLNSCADDTSRDHSKPQATQ